MNTDGDLSYKRIKDNLLEKARRKEKKQNIRSTVFQKVAVKEFPNCSFFL